MATLKRAFNTAVRLHSSTCKSLARPPNTAAYRTTTLPRITKVIAANNHYYSTGIAQDIMASRLDSLVHHRYLDLDTSDYVMATYVWIDGSNVSRL